jgi:Na+/melibiose symporter-like transporter
MPAPDTAIPPARLTTVQLTRLSALWFGLQFFWITNQLIVLPDKIRAFVPLESLGFYRALLDSVGAALVIVTQLSAGFLSDHAESRLGRRRPFILFGVLGGMVGIAAFFFAPGYWWLFGAMLLIQFTLNVATVPFQSLLPDLVPRHQHSLAGAFMGIAHLSGNICGLLSQLVMVFVFSSAAGSGLLTFLLPAYIIVLGGTMALSVFGIDETGWQQQARDSVAGAVRRVRLLPGVVASYSAKLGGVIPAVARTYLSIDLRRTPDFMWLALSRGAVYMGYTTFIDWVNYYTKVNLDWRGWLTGLGLSESWGAMVLPALLLCFLIGGVAGSRLSAHIARRFSKRTAVAAGVISAGLLFIPLIFTTNVWTAIALGLGIGLGWGVFLSADWAFACTLMPTGRAGVYMGLWMIFSLLPATLSPLISGPVRDGVFGALAPQLGQLAAEATAHQVVFSLIVVYFITGLVLLTRVSPRAGMETAT